MKVSDLIARLSQLPQDAVVGRIEADFDYMGTGYYELQDFDCTEGFVDLRFKMTEFVHDYLDD